MKTKADIGIIVGRFQVTNLHKAHRELLDKVTQDHKKVIVFLGQSPLVTSSRSPLDMFTRQKMIQEAYPGIIVSHIMDEPTDQGWCRTLDRRIQELYPLSSPNNTILYGGRDSFIKHYRGIGIFPTEELEIFAEISGTENRQITARSPLASKDFRCGVIYANANRFPTSYQTVDIACIHDNKILLGTKKTDPAHVCLIGGFVDPKDESLEKAARREFMEETGGEPGKMSYVGSFRVDDWRYRSETDKIMTALFQTDLIFGPVCPRDDIYSLEWIELRSILNLDWVKKNICLAHQPLILALKEELFPF